jgi:hypothetical protein
VTQHDPARRSRIGKTRHGLALLPVVALLAGAPTSAWAGEQSLVREGGFGFASAVVSVLYGPLKLVYATSGLLLGGSSFLWTWGDQDTAMTIVSMSVGGDYVITPAHLGGTDDIRFTGEPRT